MPKSKTDEVMFVLKECNIDIYYIQTEMTMIAEVVPIGLFMVKLYK